MVNIAVQIQLVMLRWGQTTSGLWFSFKNLDSKLIGLSKELCGLCDSEFGLVRDRVLSCGLNGRVREGATLAEHLPLPEATSGFGVVALALCIIRIHYYLLGVLILGDGENWPQSSHPDLCEQNRCS